MTGSRLRTLPNNDCQRSAWSTCSPPVLPVVNNLLKSAACSWSELAKSIAFSCKLVPFGVFVPEVLEDVALDLPLLLAFDLI